MGGPLLLRGYVLALTTWRSTARGTGKWGGGARGDDGGLGVWISTASLLLQDCLLMVRRQVRTRAFPYSLRRGWDLVGKTDRCDGSEGALSLSSRTVFQFG